MSCDHVRGTDRCQFDRRLDYFVVSQALLPRVTDSYIRKYIMGSEYASLIVRSHYSLMSYYIAVTARLFCTWGNDHVARSEFIDFEINR